MNMKIFGQILSVSLIMNLTTPLYAATPSPQPTLPTKITQVAIPTKQEIDQQLETIKKTIKGFKTINAVVTTLMVGGIATGVIITLATVIGGVALAIIVPGAIVAEGAATAAPFTLLAGEVFKDVVAGKLMMDAAMAMTIINGLNASAATATGAAAASAAIVGTTSISAAAAATLIADVIIGGTVATLVAGSLGKMGLKILGGIDATTILTAFVNIQKIEKLEAAHPGTLTKEQALVITQFKNVLKGPIAKGIGKGLQLKKIKGTLSMQALTQNPSLIATLGGDKKAQKLIETYFDDMKQLTNLRITNQVYKTQKETIQKERNQYKKLTPKHIKLDLKVAGLDLKFAFVPLQLSALEKKMTKIHQKYQGIEKMLEASTQMFIQESDKVIAELASPTK